MIYALINQETGEVVNKIVLEPGSSWPIPEGHFLLQSDTADKGDLWDGEAFIKPSTEQGEMEA